MSKMAGSLEAPSIPPEQEVEVGRYCYVPCSINEPPMDSNTLMHYFYTDPSRHTDSLWAPRLPKKLGTGLTQFGRPLEQGLGIQIQEAAHWGYSLLLCL